MIPLKQSRHRSNSPAARRLQLGFDFEQAAVTPKGLVYAAALAMTMWDRRSAKRTIRRRQEAIFAK